MTDYATTIESIKRPLTILFVVIWDVMVAFMIWQTPNFDWKHMLFVIFGIFINVIIFKQLLSKLEVRISDDTLLFRILIFNVPFKTNAYLLKEISELDVKLDAEEQTYWGTQGLRKFDRTPFVLSFKYKGKKVEHGLSFNWTNIDETIRELKRRMN